MCLKMQKIQFVCLVCAHAIGMCGLEENSEHFLKNFMGFCFLQFHNEKWSEGKIQTFVQRESNAS